MFLKITVASMAVALGTSLSLAGAAGGCGMGGSDCAMMGADHQQHATAPTTAPATQPAKAYTCPMHPEVASDKPAKCPKCGMNLEPQPASNPQAPPDAPGEHQHGH